jgi:hypothetical protein
MSAKTTTTQPVTFPSAETYASLDQSGKASARADVAKARDAAIRNGDLATATSAIVWLDTMKSTSTRPAVEVNWSARVADRIVTLRYAADLLESGLVRPANVPESAAVVLVDGLEGRTEGTADLASAVSLASARAGRAGKRGDIAEHILEVLEEAGAEVNLTVHQIANKVTSAYPDVRPSDGAVAARLFGKNGCTVEGVTAHEATATSPRCASLDATE